MTPASTKKKVDQIERWASKQETEWRAENAERDLADEFVRWCNSPRVQRDPRDVYAIASQIARCFDMGFMRTYAEEASF